nr:trehalose-6-phosphate synthase [Paenalcaligenes hominis]
MESYQQQQNELESLAGQINGKHASFNWIPLIYLNRAVAPVMLMSIFRKAHVGFIAPLRDGMNLVAKEYVAAQDAADPGVLVLSEFTGAASEFQEGALLVNPYDTEATAQALYRALTMSLAERQARHQALMAHLEEFDLKRWCVSFLSDLNAVLETEATPSLQN